MESGFINYLKFECNVLNMFISGDIFPTTINQSCAQRPLFIPPDPLCSPKGSPGLLLLVGLSYRKNELEIGGREQMGSGIYFSCFLLLSVLSSLLLPRTRLVAEASGRPVQSAVQLWVMGQLPPPAFQPVDDNGPSAHLLIPVAHSFVWCPYLLPRASQ